MIVAYTGSQVWVGRPEIRPSRKGRAEHGPGLYFTTSQQTARKYGKGARTVLRVEIDTPSVWLEDALVPIELLVRWADKQRGLRRKSEIIDDLWARAGRGLDEGLGRASSLVNLMVNNEATGGSHGPALAEFLSGLGIGASHVKMSDEDWIVVFDPALIRSWRRVDPGDPHDLPPIR